VLILKDRTNAQGQVEAGGRRCILGFTAIVGTDSREAPLPSSLSHIPPFPPHKGEFDKVNSTGCSCEPGLSSLRPFFVHTFPLSLIPPPPPSLLPRLALTVARAVESKRRLCGQNCLCDTSLSI
jgi:hypothetical protein